MGHWAERYVGIPYRRRGAGFDGVDCWGLARLVYAEEGGPALPEHHAIDYRDFDAIAAAIEAGAEAGPWRGVAAGEERKLDLVVIHDIVRGRRLPVHMGIVTGPGHLIHAEREREVMHLPFRDGPTFRAHPSLRFMVGGIFRHAALAGGTIVRVDCAEGFTAQAEPMRGGVRVRVGASA